MIAPRILIVEDESLVAADLESLLSRLGYLVAGIADNGPDALRTARQRPVDLALLDIKILGELDGIQTAAELHQDLEVPVVFLTSHTDPRTLERAGATAPYGYIAKPYDERSLHATIEMALYKQAEDKLMQQIGHWLTSVLLEAGEPILAANRTGRILFLNPAAEALAGWSLADAKGRLTSELLMLIDEKTGEALAASLTEGDRNAGAASPRASALLLRRDGSRVAIEYAVRPFSDGQGQPGGAVWVIRDVTQHKLRENDLRASNERLQDQNAELQAFANALSHCHDNPLDEE